VSNPPGLPINRRIGHDFIWLAKISCQTFNSPVKNTLYVTLIVFPLGPYIHELVFSFVVLARYLGARIAQLIKSLDIILRIAGSGLTVGGVLFWYRPLASLSLPIASVTSEHRGKNNRGP